MAKAQGAVCVSAVIRLVCCTFNATTAQRVSGERAVGKVRPNLTIGITTRVGTQIVIGDDDFFALSKRSTSLSADWRGIRCR